MNRAGNEIRVSRNDGSLFVEPSTPGLEELVSAIERWNLDDQVTMALRGHGFGGDGFGIHFPSDVNDDWEYEELGIRLAPDQVLVSYGFDDEHVVVDVASYLECLRQALVLEGLIDRAKTVERFAEDRAYADQLIEANVALCKYRFSELAKILRNLGWEEGEEIPGSKYLKLRDASYRLYYENIRQDMGVFLRSCSSQLRDFQKHPDSVENLKYTRGLESVIRGVSLLLEGERTAR